MRDHGYLNGDEQAAVLGEQVLAMIDKLSLVPPGAIAATGFEIDGCAYEIKLTKATAK
ncbi:hypothetical protein [Sphingomonas paucimobilis]|uniref:Uncharacterized protein n=1 Tax=Sphingomonas paucimobilis TaxID=13689 RepID=A0A7T3AE41_SPHPI|nr:hypothetical protein [Sphingomonas paucimobilis]QPT09864.1 hypothetical protein I6G38_06380 [Sphingomonas paucimobilis]